MTRPTRIDRTDVYSGLATMVIGLFALVESVRMPRLETLDINPYTVPGLVPGLLGVILTVLGLILLLRGLKGPRTATAETSGAGEVPETGDIAETRSRQAESRKRVLLAVGTTIGYAGFLFGQVPFVIATTIFVFAFTVGAEWLNPARPRSMAATAVGALVLALIMAFAVQYVFVEMFRVRLPG